MPLVVPKYDIKGLPLALTEDQLKAIFQQYDTNHDGVLSKQELKKSFQRLGAVIPSWRAGRGLRHADADGDGFISEKEMNDIVKYAIKFGYNFK